MTELRKKEFIQSKYIAWGLALIVLLQNPPWPLWNYGLVLGYLLSLFIFCYAGYNKNTGYLLSGIKWKRLPILYFSIVSLLIIPSFYELKLSSFFIFITYILLFRVNQEELTDSLKILTKILAFIILFSLPLWFFHVFISELPSFGILDISEMKGKEYILNNHLLFVTYKGLNFFRFYSVFDEPGVLGTLAAFILFGNRFNFKCWQNVVIFIGGIFTYSMAFYVLSLIGYFYYATYSFKRFIKTLFILCFIAGSVFYFLKDDIAFSMSVIDRFQDLGLKRIENRTGAEVNATLNKMLHSPTLIWGEGPFFLQKNKTDAGASYKLFFIEYGLIGILGLYLMYYSLILRKTRDALFFFFLFALSFIQRPWAFTSWQLVVFAAVIATLNNPRNNTNP